MLADLILPFQEDTGGKARLAALRMEDGGIEALIQLRHRQERIVRADARHDGRNTLRRLDGEDDDIVFVARFHALAQIVPGSQRADHRRRFPGRTTRPAVDHAFYRFRDGLGRRRCLPRCLESNRRVHSEAKNHKKYARQVNILPFSGYGRTVHLSSPNNLSGIVSDGWQELTDVCKLSRAAEAAATRAQSPPTRTATVSLFL